MVTPATFATAFVIAQDAVSGATGRPCHDGAVSIRPRDAVGGRGVCPVPGRAEGEPASLLVVAPASAQPSPGSLARLEHAYSFGTSWTPPWRPGP